MDRQIFRPEAFGALADGSTNDAAAFWQALDAAAAVPDSILELKKDGVKVTVQFELNVDKDEDVLVMRYVPSEEEKDTYEWVPVALDDVTVNANGTVDVVLDGEGPVAFLVKAEK